jgi:glycosyltransferase involved in cell wall biosynthesis
MKVSIITPIYLSQEESERRIPLFKQCLESIANQTYDHTDIEHIVVNDGSMVPFDVPDYPWLRVINQPNLQRLTAYNTGFKEARGEVFCVLDSDDAYEANYLESVVKWYEKFPTYKLFNFGCTFRHKDGAVSTRGAFRPKRKKVGHEVFGGGNIVNGTFVFHRSVYDELGAFPEGIKTIDVPWYKNTELFWTSPYDFSSYAQVEFPEIQPFFQVKHPDHPKGLPKELGNPWGQDFYLFYKYTRKYHSKPFDDFLYIVNLR